MACTAWRDACHAGERGGERPRAIVDAWKRRRCGGVRSAAGFAPTMAPAPSDGSEGAPAAGGGRAAYSSSATL